MFEKKKRWLSALAVVLMLVSMVSGFAIPVTAEGATAPTQNYKESLKILAVGNSFSRDAMQYLWDIAKDGGVENVVLGVLYIGGCSLDTHYANITNDAAAYTYYKNTAGAWQTTKNTSVSTGLKDEQWDIITVQQASGDSGTASTYSNLQNILDYLNTNKPKADTKIFWHMTWAYQSDSTHSDFANYNKDQWMMYQFIINAVQTQVLGNASIEGIIPSGTAVQNLRNTAVGDTVTRDGYHMSYDIGRYTLALLWNYYFTGVAPEEIEWLPADYADLITPYLTEIYTSVKKAVEDPYHVPVAAPKADLTYDQMNGIWKERNESGSYVASENYTVTEVGSGAHYNDAGHTSEKAIGFSDATTYLQFDAKNGKSFGGETGATVTFWMRETASNSDHFEAFIVSQGNDGATAVICSDSMQLFPFADVDDRWYAKMSNFYRPDFKKSKFSTSVEWCKYTAVITETDVRVYYNDTLWYFYDGTKSLNRSAGATTPTHKASEIAKALYEGFTAQNGFFRLRGGRWNERNTTTSRFDNITVYNKALTGPEVAALYYADMGQSTDETYDITYVLNGGTLEEPVTEYNSADSFKLPIPTREGYTFEGWYRTKDLRGSITMIYEGQTGDLTVFAAWKAISYPVTYDLKGGINHADNPTESSADNDGMELKPAIRKGYIFAGWYMGEEKVTHLTASGEAILLTARWKTVPADTDKDGRINVYDAVYFLRGLNGLETLPAEAECDYDQDGAVTVADVYLLLKHIDGVFVIEGGDAE